MGIKKVQGSWHLTFSLLQSFWTYTNLSQYHDAPWLTTLFWSSKNRLKYNVTCDYITCLKKRKKSLSPLTFWKHTNSRGTLPTETMFSFPMQSLFSGYSKILFFFFFTKLVNNNCLHHGLQCDISVYVYNVYWSNQGNPHLLWHHPVTAGLETLHFFITSVLGYHGLYTYNQTA